VARPQAAPLRILVTGGSGFIGRHVVRALLAGGDEVTVADREATPDGVPPASGVDVVAGDLREPAVLDAAVRPGLDAVVHLVALTSVLGSTQRPAETYETNVAVTAGLLELMRERGISRLAFASTNAVAGDDPSAPGARVLDEASALRPLTPYGATKAAAEMLLSGWSQTYGMTAAALRLTNVYGPGMERKDSFVPRLLRATRSGEPVRVYGDGEQVRDYVYVEDVARAFVVALEREHSGPLTVGAGRSVSVNTLVELARAATGAPLPVEHVAAQRGEMPRVEVDVSRARALGWVPSVDLPEGLSRAWADHVAHAEAGESATASA